MIWINLNFSLTKATEILLKYYDLWSENISKDVLVFNTHKIRHIIWVLETWRNLIIKKWKKIKIFRANILKMQN